MKKIVWPKRDDRGKVLKDGSIDGVSFTEIWKRHKKETTKYVRKKFPHLLKTQAQERRDIKALWANMSKKKKAQLQNTKGHYIG